ncbi:MAG TPA: hypothetical protein VMU32_04560 [Solirubrobacteraceae bacterium]|nr:hypothetical protein [Solirubrobacteraceae bacterium]
MSGVVMRLAIALSGRRWVIWVALACLAILAVELAVALLPHHVVHALNEYENKSNGINELTSGVREAR